MKLKIKSPVFISLVISLVFVTLIYAAYHYGLSSGQNYSNTSLPPADSPSPTITSTPVDTDLFGTITWYSKPKKISHPDILKSSTTEDGYNFDDEHGSFEVAQFSNGAKLIISSFSAPGTFNNIAKIISQNNKYHLITNLTDKYLVDGLEPDIDKEKIDFIYLSIKDLSPHHYLKINDIDFNQSVSTNSFSSRFITSLNNYKEFGNTTFGNMLYVDTEINPSIGLKDRNYYLYLKDHTLLSYHIQSSLYINDNHVPYFTYLNGPVNQVVYETAAHDCGQQNHTTIIKDLSLLNNKVMIGNTPTGLPIYKVKDLNNKLFQYLYNQYKSTRDYPSAPPTLSPEQYTEENTHIIFQEKTGDWILLINPEFGTQVECGKPVIYLYPPQETQVTVKVGADITQSEPHYPSNGWTVLAQPNGQLNYQNQTYPNLFWEGTGHGLYPNLGNDGFVIKKENLVATIKNHLSLQGLNQNEIQDFMEFWEPKLPTTPYTRLTWLTTADMNHLAPLTVTPVPDTVIRVFLDFKGLDQPIKLVPQQFTTPTRTGFTLVEWGGLLLH